MSDPHVRKSLISEKQRASAEGKSSDKAKPGKGKDSGGDGSDASAKKMRVIAFSALFVLLLAYVGYQYGWANREPPYEEPVSAHPEEQPAAPGQPRSTPTPEEKPPERNDVIQG